MVLPEDLRSELLRSYSRDELAKYHRALLNAVEIWRHAGVWRAPSKASINTSRFQLNPLYPHRLTVVGGLINYLVGGAKSVSEDAHDIEREEGSATD